MTIDYRALSEFLLARLAELEKSVRPAGHTSLSSVQLAPDQVDRPADLPATWDYGPYILADIADKRVIVQDYLEAEANPRPFPSVMVRAATLRNVVQLLAQSFHEHPDYRPEWAA